MKILFAFLFIMAASIVAGTSPVFGWGQSGHRITAEIGERNINEKTRAAIRLIIGNETLAEISTWPDEMRSDSEWDFSQPWHFLSINDDEQWDDFERAPEEEGDVLFALETLEKFLTDPNTDSIVLSGIVKKGGKFSKKKVNQRKIIGKREALAFYVHFVGDIHQPLHVGRREDMGGNKIGVEWFNEQTNLHKVWDELLIGSTNLSFTELATFLNRVSEQDQLAWTAHSYLAWAKEAKAVRGKVYDFGKQKKPYYLNVIAPPVLEWTYRFETLPIIEKQLAKGGIRLSAKLNDIFSGYPL